MKLDVRIRHRIGDFRVDCGFEAPSGVTALFGHSGSGKTTVINAVAGLLRPDEGRVAVGGDLLVDTAQGVWLPPRCRRVGYVFQEGRLFPHLSVRGNLLYGRKPGSGAAGDAEFGRVVDLLGVGRLLDRKPRGLSGGEKQRVAIGRALLSDPRVLLMDEPLAALDEARRGEILPYLERLRDSTGIPLVYVSHSLAEVARLATTVVVLEAGGVVRSGPAAEVLADPGAVRALGQREAGSVLVGRVLRHHEDGLTEVAVSAGNLLLPRMEAEPGANVRIRIEAQDVLLSRERPVGLSALNILPATVTAVRQGEGPGVAVQLLSGEDRILARITRRSADALGIRPGAECYGIMKSMAVARGNVGLGPARQASASEVGADTAHGIEKKLRD